jgi:hypothetical protein
MEEETNFHYIQGYNTSQAQWLRPVILASQEAEIRKITV